MNECKRERPFLKAVTGSLFATSGAQHPATFGLAPSCHGGRAVRVAANGRPSSSDRGYGQTPDGRWSRMARIHQGRRGIPVRDGLYARSRTFANVWIGSRAGVPVHTRQFEDTVRAVLRSSNCRLYGFYVHAGNSVSRHGHHRVSMVPISSCRVLQYAP